MRSCRTTSSSRSIRCFSISGSSASRFRSPSRSRHSSPAGSARRGSTDTRRWAVLAFGFLTVGIVLGAWWSYESFGWGGFWGWDGRERSAVAVAHGNRLPPLGDGPGATGTAPDLEPFAARRHLLAHDPRHLPHPFGVIDSLHSFSDSGIGPALITYFGVVVVVGIGLIGWRGDRLSSSGSIDAPISCEGAFLVNNLLFATFAFVVLVGTVFPLFVAGSPTSSLDRPAVLHGVQRPARDRACSSSWPWPRHCRGGGGASSSCSGAPRCRHGSLAGPSSSSSPPGSGASLRSSRSGSAPSPRPPRSVSSCSQGSSPTGGVSGWSGAWSDAANGGMVVHVGVVVIAVDYGRDELRARAGGHAPAGSLGRRRRPPPHLRALADLHGREPARYRRAR